MDSWSVTGLMVVAIVALSGLQLLRDISPGKVRADDIRLFQDRYRRRGLKIIDVRRVGTDRLLVGSLRRAGPIRKYEIELETPDGRRETRIRGVARAEYGGDRVWRYDQHGRPQQLQ